MSIQKHPKSSKESRLPASEGLPWVSVVVRSYHRRESLLNLVQTLLEQAYPQFEVIVVEQSEWTEAERAPLDAMVARDPRLRVLYSRPLGLGGARNAGWRASRYEVILSLDDDDLPLGSDFIAGHAKNYADPDVIGVSGRDVYTPDEHCGYHSRARAKRCCLRYSFWGYPHAYCRFDARVESVDWIHGTNGSVRKSVVERVGGWDAESIDHDEHPFCLALLNRLRPGERMLFDPTMVLLRSKHIPGGANVRWVEARQTFCSWHRYYHRLVMKHRPWRSIVLYPLFPIASLVSTIRWIWVDALRYSRSAERLGATVATLLSSPFWYLRELVAPPVPRRSGHVASTGR